MEYLQKAMEAINKWLYFGWNFGLVYHKWDGFSGIMAETIPVFIRDAKWTCSLDHMLDKWHEAIKSGNTDAYLVKFYSMLDGENRIALMKWVLENYDDEMKLPR